MGLRDDNADSNGQNDASSKEFRTGRDFLTYEDIEVFPGRRLNVVMGPNGSGKSSIVCAICLALGGSPKVLGRAEEIKKFVRRGCQEATIEVEIYDPAGNKTIRRVFRDDAAKKSDSQWSVNDRKKTEKEVLELVAKYNIQIENLCQFLPQDRVGDFSRLTPSSLLVETQKALQAQDLYASHQKLIELQVKERRLKKEVDSSRGALESLTRANDRVARDVERMQKKDELKRQIEVMQQKELLLRVDELRKEAQELKQKKQDVNDRIKDAEQRLAPYVDRVSQLEQYAKTYSARANKEKSKCQTLERDVTATRDKVEAKEDEEANLRGELEQNERLRKENEKNLETEKDALADLQEQLEAAGDMSVLEAAYEEAKKKSAEVRDQETELKVLRGQKAAELDPINHQLRELKTRMGQLQNVQRQKLERIRKGDHEAFRVYQWLEQNRARFKRRVWGPLISHVNVRDAMVALCLEQQVPNSILTAFIAECREDNNVMYEELREKAQPKYRFTLSQIEGGILRRDQPLYDDAVMQRLKNEFGIRGYLIDLIEAPPSVLQCLKDQSRIHHVLVGTEKTEQALSTQSGMNSVIDLLIEKDHPNRNSFSIFTPKSQYTATTSKYGARNVSIRTSDLRSQLKYLSVGADDLQNERRMEMERQQQELERQHQEISEALKGISSELEGVNQKARALHKEVDKRRGDMRERVSLINQIKSKTKKIQQLEDMLKIDTSKTKASLAQDIVKCVKARARLISDLAELNAKYLEAHIKAVAAKMSEARAKALVLKVRNEREDLNNLLEDLKQELEEVKGIFRNKLKELKDTNERVEKEVPDTEEFAVEAEKYPDDRPTLLARLREVMVEAESIVVNHQLIKEFNARQEQIKESEVELETIQQDHDCLLEEIRGIEGPWKEKLTNIFDKINRSFSLYFKEVGHCGGVELAPHSDYSQWSAKIIVQFRANGTKQTLDGAVQSGGERAVSTILYLMALQDLTPCPFRVVDEINQGMDAINERLIFKRIVSLSCGRGVALPQYFLITPKLLPNLRYHRDVSVLLVFNGPYVPHYRKWDIDLFVKKRKALDSGKEKSKKSKQRTI